ncbi:hypothetical protein [Photobacterium nomapromontoriensis]|uniref:hypothetical protein n=1 Tax=Photobacterium nomapromontoriensis TaxID=2910237 RepID=UPI003D0CD8D6
MDIGIALNGLAKHVINPASIKLYNNIDTDNIRAYKTLTKYGLGKEVMGIGITASETYEEVENGN